MHDWLHFWSYLKNNGVKKKRQFCWVRRLTEADKDKASPKGGVANPLTLAPGKETTAGTSSFPSSTGQNWSNKRVRVVGTEETGSFGLPGAASLTALICSVVIMCDREALGVYLQLSHKVYTFSHHYSAVLFKEELVQRQEVKIKTDLDVEHADENQIQFYYYK